MPWKAAARSEPSQKTKTHHPHAVPLPPPLAAVVAAASAADDRRTDIPHTPAGGGRRRVADPTQARSSSILPLGFGVGNRSGSRIKFLVH
uniref:Uncharacterized protein n=1 Tax=Oryza barthii TaxID=65489 RepID=A0A0D3H8A3_9ORYZ